MAALAAGAESKATTALGTFRLLTSDSSVECLDEAVNSATRAMKANRDEVRFCEVAQAIKKDMTAKFPGTWHVIVGGQFGAQVTHEASTVSVGIGTFVYLRADFTDHFPLLIAAQLFFLGPSRSASFQTWIIHEICRFKSEEQPVLLCISVLRMR